MSDEKLLEVRPGEYMHVANDENKCDVCNKKSSACISFFAHENALMHKDLDTARPAPFGAGRFFIFQGGYPHVPDLSAPDHSAQCRLMSP